MGHISGTTEPIRMVHLSNSAEFNQEHDCSIVCLRQRWAIPIPESVPNFTNLELESESESTFFSQLEAEPESQSDQWTGIGAGIMHHGVSLHSGIMLILTNILAILHLITLCFLCILYL